MKERPVTGRVLRNHSDAKQWSPPEMAGASAPKGNDQDETPLLTAAQLEDLQKKAHEEGFERGRKEGIEYGHREGLEEGRAQIQERIARFDQILEMLDQPFEQLDDQVENEIVTLVISMVRQLVRREIRMDPQQVIGIVREALAVLPVNSRSIRVLLHPDDAESVRGAYTIGDTDQKWMIVEDPVIQRGGCRVLTETSQVDATLESRLNALIAPLLAGQRGRDE